ncbi:MAG: transglycosylase SLT domain-containing protein [Halioglobus sp.]|nr:transglycosylase SLT domain-containing protein [Halioglobus sp.]
MSALFAAPAPALTTPLDAARQHYGDAVQAIDRGRWGDYHKLRPGLDDYPLAIYLDYFELSRQAHKVRPVQARRFISRSADSPLPHRFLSVYLQRAGTDGRWGDFLQVMPDEPNSVELKCYYFRARLAQGDTAAAWAGARRLWVHGQSQPKACDPLFAAWLKAGQLTDEVVWARLLKAFDARQQSLMRYVARKASPALSPWADTLLAVYTRPERLRAHTLPAGSPYAADIASHGLAYLARYSPEKALDWWLHYSNVLAFSAQQVHDVEHAIARHSLLAETASHIPWLEGALRRLGDDRLVEMRLRWALSEQDWPALENTLALLSAPGRAEDVWRYWQALALQQRGAAEQAQRLLQDLAGERSYYGFLAADRLGGNYSFNNRPLLPATAQPLLQMPALQRIGELQFHEEDNLAQSEWYKVLHDTADSEQQQQLAQLAAQRGWHRMAIDAANRARAWDALNLRFPTPYRNTFAQYGAQQRVPSTELMAIARRESAFFPHARSPVGARGLMQIMPATGRQVAASLGQSLNRTDLYQVEQNVLLGSAYYRQMLDRFGDNRVFALTAYNAGPHRVDRWRSQGGAGLPVEIWIETIPYRETRNYVQAVLSYNVVFQYLTGDSARLLTPQERLARY